MGLNYAIDCCSCGTHSEYRTTINIRGGEANLNFANHVDTECAIRCPVCRARLNKSEVEFHRQVSITLSK
jgi:hypothetical protein